MKTRSLGPPGINVFIYRYQCDVCQLEVGTRRGQPGYYQFSDGGRIPALTEPVWCNCCAAITLAERIPHMDDLFARLEQLNSGDLSAEELEFIADLKENVDEHIQSCIDTCQTMISRFAQRNTPNCCIECGSSDFAMLADDEGCMPQTIPYHDCAGILTLKEWVHGSPATFFLLDVDGNRIPAKES